MWWWRSLCGAEHWPQWNGCWHYKLGKAKSMDQGMYQTDFLVIGSGIAGLFSALRLAAHGDVILVTKSDLEDSNSYFAQGGMAAALKEPDTPELHEEDTLRAGA